MSGVVERFLFFFGESKFVFRDFVALLLLAPDCGLPCAKVEPAKGGTQQSLETTYTKWTKELSSNNKVDRVKTLESMLPQKKDVEYLFPKYADKVWSAFSEVRKEIIAKEAEFAGEFVRSKDQQPNYIDIRKEKDDMVIRLRYQRLLEIIPKDVAVYESRSITAFVYVNGRWIWFPLIDGCLPENLEKVK